VAPNSAYGLSASGNHWSNRVGEQQPTRQFDAESVATTCVTAERSVGERREAS
jgi:hypothetical protein